MIMRKRMKKMNVDSIVICKWMVYIKKGKFVKKKNEKFKNVYSLNKIIMWEKNLKYWWVFNF
jgi:hypothetical protein